MKYTQFLKQQQSRSTPQVVNLHNLWKNWCGTKPFQFSSKIVYYNSRVQSPKLESTKMINPLRGRPSNIWRISYHYYYYYQYILLNSTMVRLWSDPSKFDMESCYSTVSCKVFIKSTSTLLNCPQRKLTQSCAKRDLYKISKYKHWMNTFLLFS